MSPDLTIAIPVFNRTTYFRQALESALDQTVEVPVMVVDNASDKGNFQGILGSYAQQRISYHRNSKNLGMAGNWNRCIELCRTKYLLILHDDDFLPANYIEAFLNQVSSGAALYFTDALMVDESGMPSGETNGVLINQTGELTTWCFNNPVLAGAVFDVDLARRIGGFSERIRYSLDWDLWFRLFLAGPVQFIPNVRPKYRVYNSLDRGTTQLAGGARSLRFNRNQFKRNFSHIRAWALYRGMRRAGLIPRPRLNALVRAYGEFKPSERRYWASICSFGPSNNFSQKLLRLSFKIFGSRLFLLLRFMAPGTTS